MAINAAQQCAIAHGSGPMMVLAGPGSGKTFVITRRIQYLIEKYKIPPEQILVITFTKASALEMQERFEQLMGDVYAPVNFGTFHAIYFHILKNAYHYDFSNIITEKEKITFLKEVLSLYPDLEDNTSTYIPLLLSEFSYLKNYGYDPNQHKVAYLEGNQFAEIYQKYQKKLDRMKKLDFDDMVLLCRDLLKKDQSALMMWRERFSYILIDEFQDINAMQYEVIRLLASPRNNLFVVGDDDQSIYGFRGSDPSIMLHFPDDYKECKQVVLNYNYRCTANIVDSAMRLISHNKNRFQKELNAVKKGIQDVVILEQESKEMEKQTIVNLISQYHQIGDYKDIAIIIRTNSSAAYLAQALSEKGIPFRQKEKIKNPFTSSVALDIIAILKFASGETDRATFLRFMNKPVRYLKREMIGKNVNLSELIQNRELPDYVKEKVRRLMYDMEKIQSMCPYLAINYIRKGMEYDSYLKKELRGNNSKWEENAELLDFIQQSSKSYETPADWFDMIEEYDENLKSGNQNTESEELDAVAIITMHGSKGLEYPVVLLPDLNEGNVPQAKAETTEAIEEERRVFYVAMTRAKEKLIMLYIKKTKENRLIPSRFLKEL